MCTKGDKLKRKIKLFVLYPSLFLLLIVCGIAVYLYYLINHIPEGEFTHGYPSPNRQCTINIYVIDGTLSQFAARGELVNVHTGDKRTIYFNYPDENPYVKWLNNNEVVIGDKTLDITKSESYNWRDDTRVHTSEDNFPRQADN